MYDLESIIRAAEQAIADLPEGEVSSLSPYYLHASLDERIAEGGAE